ncbi:IS110 family transposase [Stygiobacter electus]|uniref:IS110 family transposase n=1 Tax=Stygiobacter electus TaxID=3032292 RepID=A0AAE3P379_9BACT|nr:IS110 family transposase [Stygiobacter electus]MDF1613329.1 IS110 family transposase [Stygiobacter electus]
MNNLSFKNNTFFIGIDTHLKSWKVSIRNSGVELKTFSMNPSPIELFSYLTKHYPDGSFNIVYEAGFSGFWPQRKFKELGINCMVVNPADIPSSNKEKVVKTDPTDSRKLARELENNSLRPIYIPDVYAEQLRSLMRVRFKLVQTQTRIKNRIKMLLYNYGIVIPKEHLNNSRWSGYFINWLHSVKLSCNAGQLTLNNHLLQLQQCRDNLKMVLHQLREEAKNKSIEPIINSLVSVPGIAFITAMSLYTEIIDIQRFKSFDHLASFVGLVPSLYSSGNTEYSRGISFRHNKFLRPLIIEAAWTAIRKDPAITLVYAQLIKQMSKQKAIIKIAKKLLSRIRHVWIQQEEYQFALVA